MSLVTNLDRRRFNPIVLLPQQGPLLSLLKEAGVRTHVLPLGLVSRADFNLAGLLLFPFRVLRAVAAIDKALRGVKVDIVHSNTLAVWGGAAWAKYKGIPHVWMVREIILKPRSIRRIYALALRLFTARVVFNSFATRESVLPGQTVLARRSSVIWNGVERLTAENHQAVHDLKERLSLSPGDILIAMVGRINRWKGQELFIEAAERLFSEGLRDVRFLIVGSAFYKEDRCQDALLKRVANSAARDRITVLGFQTDIWTVWDACDIAVVPSTEPEPFGRVAVEAMLSRKPVVAAAHGGLKEVVEDGLTGVLFEPGSVSSLAAAILRLIRDEKERVRMGNNGFIKANRDFTAEQNVRSFERLYEAAIRTPKA